MSEPRSSDLMVVAIGDVPVQFPMTPIQNFRNVFFPLGNLHSGKPWPSGGVMPFFDSTGIGYLAIPPVFAYGYPG